MHEPSVTFVVRNHDDFGPSTAKQIFLAKLGEWLTMVGRDTYKGHVGVGDATRSRVVNEALHWVLDQLHQMLPSSAHRYPDDVFANILADQIEALNVHEVTFRRLLN
jgi:hypothetical protein